MAAQAAPTSIEPAFGTGDRLKKSRKHCGIDSAADMAKRLSDRLGKPIAASTVNAWEADRNQPTHVRMDVLIPEWVDICNEAGALLDPPRSTSVEFVYGLRTGSFSPDLTALPEPTGQTTLLDDEGQPLDFYERPFLTSV